LYLVRDLAPKASAEHLVAWLDSQIQRVEQAEALQRDAARLVVFSESSEPIWITFGEPAWFVSQVPAPGGRDRIVVAVDAGEVFKRLSSPTRQVRMATVVDTTADTLGESFPGLRVALSDAALPTNTGRGSFLGAVLALALAFTLLAGYLLWRDVQRDLRLAEMRSQFVSSVTHELRTPLTAIRMFTETMRLDEDVDQQTRRDYLDTILHESERLSRLVENVLDFGKIESGKKIYRLKPARLDQVVEDAARAFHYPLERSGFVLDTSLDRSLPTIAADSDALQQAILNLLSNAMKYSGNSRQIALALNRQNGDARIQVSDHGIGIASDEQRRIFERFYRAAVNENDHIPGTGLGLTLADSIVKAHGGKLEVQSNPGKGSTFTIRLPLEAGRQK
jgi:signal transduction histidine kinase